MTCLDCTRGHRCPTTTALPLECLPGTYSESKSIECTFCPSGKMCLNPSEDPIGKLRFMTQVSLDRFNCLFALISIHSSYLSMCRRLLCPWRINVMYNGTSRNVCTINACFTRRLPEWNLFFRCCNELHRM